MRWYKGFSCSGITPERLVDQVASIVRREQLGDVLPVVRCEKRTGRARMFYFFMAVESEAVGDIPEIIQSSLLQLSPFRSPLPGSLTVEQIRSMVGAELDVHDYARRMRYHIENELDTFDPFGDYDDEYKIRTTTSEQKSDEIIKRTEQYDKLLYWLSMTGGGSSASFQQACRTLGLDPDGKQSGRIWRRLRLLGHIEVSRDGSRWSCAPPVLTYAPSLDSCTGSISFILCGCRLPHLVTQLRLIADVALLPQEAGDGPSTLIVTAADADKFWATLAVAGDTTAQILANRVAGWGNLPYINNGGDVALRLARVLPVIQDWIGMLECVPGVTPQMYELRRYSDGQFIDAQFQGQTGFYQLWQTNTSCNNSGPRLELFFDAQSARWLRGDWYGVRFAAQQLSSEPCVIKYYSAFQRLAVNATQRWPELYERSLVLASGRLPVRNGPWLVYEGIHEALLMEISRKINIERLRTHYDA